MINMKKYLIMSDEDHALSNDSYFGSDMKNDDDTIEIIYRNLNRAQVNILRLVKKMCCIEFYYTDERYCSLCMRKNKRSIFKSSCRSKT